MFLLGFFDKRANAAGAYTALIGSLVMNMALSLAAPDMPFVIRIWFVFMASLVVSVAVSRFTAPPSEDGTVKLDDIGFATSTLFNTLAVIVVAILIGLYAFLW